MATTVTFGASTTITGPIAPTPVDQVPIWVTDLSEAGTRFVYKTRSQILWRWRMTFNDLSDTEKAALQTFFDSTAQGPSNTFNFTHTDGVTRSGVRFVDTFLAWQRSGSKLWSVTITLELTASP